MGKLMDDEIKFRLVGSNVRPGLISSHDLAEILEAVESFASSEAHKTHPNLSKEDLIVGLYAIEDRSIGLRFKTNSSQAIIPVFVSAMLSVASFDFSELTPNSLKSLNTITAFARKHSCKVEVTARGSVNPLVVIDANMQIPEPMRLKGETQIVGKLIRVGGKSPKAAIEPESGGNLLYCDIPEFMAVDLGHMLYERVIFEGLAEWDAKTMEMQSFKISDFMSFKNESPVLVLENLGKKFGDVFNEIDDVVSFVDKMRSDN